jgi:hypothetical protein
LDGISSLLTKTAIEPGTISFKNRALLAVNSSGRCGKNFMASKFRNFAGIRLQKKKLHSRKAPMIVPSDELPVAVPA